MCKKTLQEILYRLGFYLLALALVGCAASSTPGMLQHNAIHETTLNNGLKIIIKEDHRAPVLVSQIWYKVGSSYEPDGITGISHVLEHMMFKGTKRLGPGEFSRIIAENGGRENAFTGADYTAYFQQLEKSRLPVSLELEADRMRNLTLDPAELKKEIQVVIEERRLRTEDNPQAKLYERFMATAYQKHSYGRPIIGWQRDLENITSEKLLDWYNRWYSPNNAILVIAGDVDPTEVIALAKRYFGDIPARPIAAPDIPTEPPQRSARRVSIALPARVPYLLFGYHVPAFTEGSANKEAYALQVLAGILDGGNSARFQRALVREHQIAAQAGASYRGTSRWPTMFYVDGTPAAGHNVKTLERALLEQIELLKQKPVGNEELERVKTQVAAEMIYQQDSIFYQAMQIGGLATVGLDWRLLNQHVSAIRAVTAEEVQSVAQRYLTENNRTTAILKPLPMKTNKMRTQGQHAH